MTMRDSYSEIILNGMALPLKSGTMPESNLAVFQRKMTTGDYSKDSNPLLSSWVISDLSGGNGIYDMNESSDSTRYYYGNMYTRFPAQISSGIQAGVSVGTSANTRRLHSTVAATRTSPSWMQTIGI